jgi:hypothetical protein
MVEISLRLSSSEAKNIVTFESWRMMLSLLIICCILGNEVGPLST